MAFDTNTLLADTKCYACLGLSMHQLLELGILRRILVNRSPTTDVSMQALMDYSECYACYGLSAFRLLQLALLDIIAQTIQPSNANFNSILAESGNSLTTEGGDNLNTES